MDMLFEKESAMDPLWSSFQEIGSNRSELTTGDVHFGRPERSAVVLKRLLCGDDDILFESVSSPPRGPSQISYSMSNVNYGVPSESARCIAPSVFPPSPNSETRDRFSSSRIHSFIELSNATFQILRHSSYRAIV